jgi:hypothetical protein
LSRRSAAALFRGRPSDQRGRGSRRGAVVEIISEFGARVRWTANSHRLRQ